MEIVVQILMLFIVIGCIVKISFNRIVYALSFGLVAALFILFTYKYAIVQSKSQITDFLANVKFMQDIAVLITLEAGVM